jgi:hypothetical protein
MSDLFAYDFINCITTDENPLVKEFWKYYRGPGVISRALLDMNSLNIRSILNDRRRDISPRTEYLRFKDLRQKCLDLTVATFAVSRPDHFTTWKSGIVISQHSTETLVSMTVSVLIVRVFSF